jgi:hypothetical protein
MQFTGTLPYGTVVAGDVAPSGRQVLIKTYFVMRHYGRTNGETVAEALDGSWTVVPSALEPQGEAVCWQGREEGYFTLSENAAQPVNYIASDDSDADGLPDSAEVAAGSDMDVKDSDGDGRDDGSESIAGTDLTNSAAFFAVADVSVETNRVVLRWEARTNRAYAIERAGPTNALYETIASNVTVAADGIYTTNMASGTGPELFRVTVRDASGW